MVDRSGVSKSKTSTIEVTAETEKEVMTLDDDETFGSFYKSASPSTLDSSVVVTEEDLSQIQANTPKLVHNNLKWIINIFITRFKRTCCASNSQKYAIYGSFA